MKRITIFTVKDGVDHATVDATLLAEDGDGVEFELPLGLSLGLGITHFVERNGSRTQIDPTEMDFRKDGKTPIYRYVATFV